MNRIARLIVTALIAAVAFVAVPATAANAEPCGVLNCTPPPECTVLSCPNPPEPPCTLLSCPARVAPCEVDPALHDLRAAAGVSASKIDDLTAETSTLHALVASKDKRIAADAVKISRLQAKVQQLRERLRSR